MPISPFHALYKARELVSLSFGKDKLLPVFASSDIKVFPFQIAAAMFAMRSPYLKGVILCDDGSLGKTYEAMLVIVQKWYEGANRIIIIVPTQLLFQWVEILNTRFSVPFFSIDNNTVWNDCIANGENNPFEQDGIVITTYDFAAEKAEYISKINWSLSIFEEAHHLRRIYTGENKGALAIKNAVGNSFKILLTATPMQNSIMDLYGLINIIDETVFPNEKAFYDRYFRKPENYEELAHRVSKFCFRTTRQQVETYVKIPNRVPITVEYTLSDKEQLLYNQLEKYLQKPTKQAFSKMDNYDLTLMLFRTLSSSTFALEKTLNSVVARLPLSDEKTEIEKMVAICHGIKENSKGKELLNTLDKGFTELKRLGAKQKALIFTENKTTQKYLYSLLNKGKYKDKVLTYSGDNTRDYSIMSQFESDAKILITTDIAAEGFNLEFCSFIINYDLPYNTLKLEQRINRCHRQGQECDVIIVNFLCKQNFADIRQLELINKRILQFDGIFGLSDDVIGNFDLDIAEVLSTARTKNEIEATFNTVLEKNEEYNREITKTAEETLFSSFSKDIAEKVTITPQYVADKTREINDKLWEITKYFLHDKQGYICEDDTHTVRIGIQPQKIFTGAHLGRREYSMTDKSLPKSGWHTITGTLAKNIIHEISWLGIPDRGMVVVDYNIVNCTIAFYEIKVKSASSYFSSWKYYRFIGKTADGHILSHEDCIKIMNLPIVSFTKDGDTYGERDGISKQKRKEPLDEMIDGGEFVRTTFEEMNTAETEEIERLKGQVVYKKAELSRNLDSLRINLEAATKEAENFTTRLEKLDKQKRLTALKRELMQKEESLFLDSLRIETELDEQIKAMVERAKLTAEVKREFIINVIGGKANG